MKVKTVVKKDIPKLSKADKEKIKKTIDIKLTKDPIFFGKPLKHNLNGQRRLRVGAYRVIYIIDDDEKLVTIFAIKHRSIIYN